MSDEEFIKSVENVIPNPPFKINIQTTMHKKVRDENSFKEVTAISLKDYSWDKNENIRTFEISLDRKEIGILGSAIVAILESRDKPVNILELNSRDVEIEGKTFTLGKDIRISENSILESSQSITINDEGEINKESSSRELARSKSQLSLHGIDVPTTLFPRTWEMKANQVRLSWPFPLIIVVDICGNRDLDLNSSRTEIIMSEKWIDFEEKLAFTICDSIANSVTSEYWNELKIIFTERTKNETFLRGINRVTK